MLNGDGEACLFYLWFAFILGMNYKCELSIRICQCLSCYSDILCHKLSLNEYLCQTGFTDRDTLLVHDSFKWPPKPSIHKTLIRSTPAITLSLTCCHLVPYRGWSNPGFLEAHQPPTNPWHFGWSLSLSGFSKKLMVEGEKNQVHCNKSDRKAHSMFPMVQPRVGVGIGLVPPFHCRGSLEFPPRKF